MANDSILVQPVVGEDIEVGVGRVEVAAPSGGQVVGNKVNLATFAIRKTFSWVAGTVAAGARATTTVTVDGAALGYHVGVAYNEDLPADAEQYAPRVSAANTVRLSIFNAGASPITLNTLTGTILVFFIPTEA